MVKEVEETTVATNDAYTGMLAVSLLALIAGCVFLALDWMQYPDRPPPRTTFPKVAAPAPVNPGNAPPANQPQANPMNPMGMPPMAQP